MSKAHILFVEDNMEYQETLDRLLTKEGYLVDSTNSPLEAIELFARNSYDAVISDLMMETLDGIKLLTHIKKTNPYVKTMILTAEPTNETEIAALDTQVDKYLVKGASLEVLIKHIEHLLNNEQSTGSKKSIKIYSEPDGLTIDIGKRTVSKNNEVVNITTKEFEVLKTLLLNRGIALSREEIVSKIWDERFEKIDIRVIDVHIRSLRKKLKIQSIVSIRGYGYKWDA